MPDWFLEQNRFLPLEMTGFRSHLSAQDCILEFTSDVQFQMSRGNSTLAVFLYLEKTYDRVRVDAVLHRLAAIGVSGRATHYLTNYIVVKLGSILSPPYQLGDGLPEGSACSSTLFNVVKSQMVFTSSRNDIPNSATLYADDICMWAASDKIRPLIQAIQDASFPDCQTG